MNAEDDVYHRTETARVLAELVRPLPIEDVDHERERLLWAFLLRSIQTQLYSHACAALYCLHKRATCRFSSLGRSRHTSSTTSAETD